MTWGDAMMWVLSIVPAVIAYRWAKQSSLARAGTRGDVKYAKETGVAAAAITWLVAAFVLVYVLGL